MRSAFICAAVQQDSLSLLRDEKLVIRAKIGDGSAYGELCRRHSGITTRIIHRIVRNHEDTEDILQEAMLKAYRHLEGFDGRAKFSTWFTRISVNCALMLLRKRKSYHASRFKNSREVRAENAFNFQTVRRVLRASWRRLNSHCD